MIYWTGGFPAQRDIHVSFHDVIMSHTIELLQVIMQQVRSPNNGHFSDIITYIFVALIAYREISSCGIIMLNPEWRPTGQIARFMVLSSPGGPHVGPMNLAIRGGFKWKYFDSSFLPLTPHRHFVSRVLWLINSLDSGDAYICINELGYSGFSHRPLLQITSGAISDNNIDIITNLTIEP